MDGKQATERLPAERVGRYRWVICGLLLAASAINYVDRQMIGILKPVLREDLGWTETDFANIVFWFQVAYAFGYVTFGRIVDLVGVRLGYAVAVSIWTVAHVAHGAVSTVTQFALARAGLGLGEAGNFPSGVKAVSEWFPARERALAIGFFTAGSNIGALITPLLVPAITIAYGWRAAFVLTGALGVAWLVAWLLISRDPARHPRVGASELAHIQQDEAVANGPRMPWKALLRRRETWSIAVARFLVDPVWWFYLFWLPSFLGDRFGLNMLQFGPPLVVIYLLSDLGSIGGGWLSSFLLKRGVEVVRARKIAMLVCAVAVLPVFAAPYVSSLWVAVLIIGVAAAAHQAFSANLYTLPSDLLPKSAIGSVVGIGGTAGAIGGMIFAKLAGFVLDDLGTYAPLFIIAASAYSLALVAIHLLTPRRAA